MNGALKVEAMQDLGQLSVCPEETEHSGGVTEAVESMCLGRQDNQVHSLKSP